MKEIEKSRSEVFIPLNDYQAILASIDCSRYSKLSSVIRLQSVGLPTLPGFVINEINDNVLGRIESWLAQTNSQRLSLRFDSPNPADNKRLTLSNPTLEDLSRMRDLLKSPIIGLVLAENDRFNQDHSVLIQFFDDSIRLEIVGPGFDAADLTRGHTSPHEIIELHRRDRQDYGLPITPLDIKSHQITGGAYYTASRFARLGVVNAVIEKGLGRNVNVAHPSPEQMQRAEDFLTSRGADLPRYYQPLSVESIEHIYSYISEIDAFRDYYKNELGIDVADRVLSSSFLKKHGLVFWDVYGAEKYQKR